MSDIHTAETPDADPFPGRVRDQYGRYQEDPPERDKSGRFKKKKKKKTK